MFVRKSTHDLALTKALAAQHEAERDSLVYHRRADQAETRLEMYRGREMTAKLKAPKPSKSEKAALKTVEHLLVGLEEAAGCSDTDRANEFIATLNAFKESARA